MAACCICAGRKSMGSQRPEQIAMGMLIRLTTAGVALALVRVPTSRPMPHKGMLATRTQTASCSH